MNLCRQGMCNGLVFEKVKETIQSCSNYIDGRRFLESEIRAQRNRIIKDIKAHGLVPERQLVRKIEKYNTISGKEHSIDEIVNQEVRGVDSDIGRLQKNVKDEIHRQSMRGRAVLQMQEAAMVMGG